MGETVTDFIPVEDKVTSDFVPVGEVTTDFTPISETPIKDLDLNELGLMGKVIIPAVKETWSGVIKPALQKIRAVDKSLEQANRTIALSDVADITEATVSLASAPFVASIKGASTIANEIATPLIGENPERKQQIETGIGNVLNVIGYASGVIAQSLGQDKETIFKIMVDNWKEGKSLGQVINQQAQLAGISPESMSGSIFRILSTGADLSTTILTLKGVKATSDFAGITGKKVITPESIAKSNAEVAPKQITQPVEQIVQPEVKVQETQKQIVPELEKINAELDLADNKFSISKQEYDNIAGELAKQDVANAELNKVIDPAKFRFMPTWDPTTDISLSPKIRMDLKDISKAEQLILRNSAPENVIGDPSIQMLDVSQKLPSWYLKDSFLTSVLSSGENTLKSFGKSGTSLFTTLYNTMRATDKYKGSWKLILDNSKISNLDAKGWSEVWDIKESKTISKDSVLNAKAKILQDLTDQIHYRAKQAGVDIDYRKNYMPHYPDWQLIEKNPDLMKQAIDSVKSVEKISDDAARIIVNYMIDRSKGNSSFRSELMKGKDIDVIQAQKVIDSLNRTPRFRNVTAEFERRYNLPYQKTGQNFMRFVEEMSERISKAEMQDNVLSPEGYPVRVVELLDNIRNEFGDSAYNNSKTIYDMFNGSYNQKIPMNSITGKAVSTITSAEVFKNGALMSINNISQPVSALIKTGEKNFVKGLIDTIKKGGMKEAEGAGVITRQIMEDFSRNRGVDQFYKITGMTASERFIRTWAYHAGKYFLEDTFNKAKADMTKGKTTTNSAAIRQLKQFDMLDILKNDKLTPEILEEGGYKLSKSTMFSGNVLDTSPAFQTTTGKLLLQFKRYSFAQGKFIKESIWDEVKKGNYVPLLRAAIYGQVAGEVVNDIRALIKGDAREEQLMSVRRWLDNYAQSVMGILLWDAIDSALKGKGSVLSKAKDLIFSNVGAGVGEVAKATSQAGNVIAKSTTGKKGEGRKAVAGATKYAEEFIPVIGQTLIKPKTNVITTPPWKNTKERLFPSRAKR